MLKTAASENKGWLAVALFWVGLITAFRIFALANSRADLFVDEAQYWFWGQELAFGYYSKPPMIGWVIRATTELAGSDSAFWVRFPAALFHAATALILGWIAARYFGAVAAIWTAVSYATLPMVAVGSLLISTDTIMFPFLALSLACYLRMGEGAKAGTAILAGIALGLAFLSKYAAIYYLVMAALSLLIIRQPRPSLKNVALMLLAFAVTISPNVIWNILNGFTTLQHTMDNANWVRDPSDRVALNITGLAEFFFSQFAVFGPVLFGALLVMGVQFVRGKLPAIQSVFLIFSLPIIVIVCGQAFLSKAYANWAATAYLAGTVATIPWLAARSRVWLIISLVINGTISVALPLATVRADTLSLFGRGLTLHRYVGLDEMSRAILLAAESNNVSTIVAEDRPILADLFYTGRGSDVKVFALAMQGRPQNHYALKFPYTNHAEERVLFVTSLGAAPECAAQEVARLTPETGAYRNAPKSIYLVPANCWETR